MIPELFSIGPVTITSFGIMAILGFLIPTFLLGKEIERYKLDPELATGIAVAAMIGGFLGARIYFIIERWDQFLAHPTHYLFTGAGLVWYGGFIGGVLAGAWYVHRKQVSVALILDLIAPLLALGQFFGRAGCLLSGDGDYGPPSDLPWAMAFPDALVPTIVPVHPTPIYDMILLMGIFLILWKVRFRKYPQGTFFSLYLVLLGIERFITEFYRNTPKLLIGITMAQWISIGLFLIGLFLLFKLFSKYRNPEISN